MAPIPPTGGSSSHGHTHAHSHGQGECHCHGHGQSHNHSHSDGHSACHGCSPHTREEELGARDPTSNRRVLAKLRGLLAEDDATTNEEEEEEEELDWSVVTCPNLHPLEKSDDERHPWSCDMARYRDLPPEASVSVDGAPKLWKRFHKNRYGLKQSERWNCLSNYNDFGKHRDEAVYHCWACNFSICSKCFARAKAAGENVESVKAMLNSNEATCAWMKSKLMVVGQARVGKTATVRALLGRSFVKDLDSTVGVNLSHARTTKKGLNWRQAVGDLKHGHAVTAAAMLVSGREQRAETAVVFGRGEARVKKEVTMESEGSANDTKVLDRVKIMASFDLEVFLEVTDADDANSNSNAISFTVWDFSGQTVFYSLHQLFLTSYGVYLVVFNCVDLLQSPSKALDFITFWLSSVRIHAAAAPVLLVGTHLDCVAGEPKLNKIDRELEAVTKGFLQVVENTRADLHYFPVSSVDGKGIASLCESIESTSRGQEFLQLRVPIKWLRCLDGVMNTNNKAWTSRELVQAEARNLGIHGVAEFDEMLSMFHELGVVVHLNATQALDNLVVLDPQWLLDEISKLIRDPEAHPYKREELDGLGLTEDWKRLEAEAICTFDYLHWLWGFERVGFFVDLLQATMLLSQWNFDHTRDKMFLVPSLVKSIPREEHNKSMTWPTCIFDFSGLYLPDGCFQRLVCLCVDYSSGLTASGPPAISKAWARFEYTSNEVFEIAAQKDMLSLAVEPPEVAAKFLAVLTSMVRKVNLDAMGGGLLWKMLYVDATGRKLTTEEAKAAELQPWFGRPLSAKHETQATQSPSYTASNLDAFLDS